MHVKIGGKEMETCYFQMHDVVDVPNNIMPAGIIQKGYSTKVYLKILQVNLVLLKNNMI